ncbi:MAG: hypothetical protein KBA38_07845 [Negativicutes bacterium]|nr:hypothetical protein [Negativicutes bacterium]
MTLLVLIALSYLGYQANKSKKAERYYKQYEQQIVLLKNFTDHLKTQDSEEKAFLRDIAKNYFKGLPPFDLKEESFQGIPLKDFFELCHTLNQSIPKSAEKTK